MDREVRQILKHFPKTISKTIEKFVTDDVLTHSRYIFMTDRKEWRVGYCSHCHKEITLPERSKHNMKTICPKCKSTTIVKHSWRKQNNIIDKTYFLYYEKSKINPQAIVCRGIYGTWTHNTASKSTDKTYETHSYYLFEPGKSTMLTAWHDYYRKLPVYEIRKSTFPRFINYQNIKGIALDISIKSIQIAIKDTVFQYSAWEHYYEHHNLADGFVKYFALYAKYPCVEYLTKMGFCQIIQDKIRGNAMLNVFNYKGKNMEKILRMKLNKQDCKELQKYRGKIRAHDLKMWQLIKKDGSKTSLTEIMEKTDNRDVAYLARVNEYVRVERALAYIDKQEEVAKAKKESSWHYNLSTYADYIHDCKLLEMDMTDKRVLFPKDLYKAHQNTIKQVKIKDNAILAQKIKKRHETLETKFSYQGKTFLIRPAATSKELIAEGKALSHCVGTYAERHAMGKTNICFIRQVAEPDKPFYTMEISNAGKIVQVHGKNNCTPPDDVKRFIKRFENAKLTKKREGKTA